MTESGNRIQPKEPRGIRKHCWMIFILAYVIFLIPNPFGYTDPDFPEPVRGHFLLTKSRADSWNDQARIATVESLVENNTLAIEHTKWGWFTGDKVLLREHFYSTKPPLLSAVGSVSYIVLRQLVKALTGHEITYLKNEDIIYPWVVLWTSVLAFALLLVYFYRSLFLVDIPSSGRWWLFWALAIGSLYPAYSTVFNNHSIAGSLLFISFYYVLRYRLYGLIRWWEAIITGIAIGFAAVTDLTGALPFLPLFFILIITRDFPESASSAKLLAQRGTVTVLSVFIFAAVILGFMRIGPRGTALLLFGPALIMILAGLFLLLRRKPVTILYLLGACIPVIVHQYLNYRITGNWLPTYIQSDVYIAVPPGYFGEVVSPEQAGILFWERWKYAGTSLFGIRGIFVYTPVLLIGLAACITAIKNTGDSLRWEAMVVAFSVVAGWGWLLLFSTPNFGGTSFGFRYALPATPLLIFFCHKVFMPGAGKIYAMIFRNAFAWGFFVSLVAIPYPWGMFSMLPSTQNSIVQNLEHIAFFTLAGR